MIIWGSTSREKNIEEGDFFCPGCRAMQPYDLIEVKRYFTLYFIPLFPTSTLGAYVKCDGCGGQFNEEILDIDPKELAIAVKPWKCSKCDNKNPGGESICLNCDEPRE